MMRFIETSGKGEIGQDQAIAEAGDDGPHQGGLKDEEAEGLTVELDLHIPDDDEYRIIG
jgi:hypothetical protein